MSSLNERQIREMIVGWMRAIADGDRESILAHHAKDMLMYDFPSTVRGIDTYSKTWDFFDDSRTGPVTFSPRDISIKVGDHMAFATCEIHCEGTTAEPLDLRLINLDTLAIKAGFRPAVRVIATRNQVWR